MLSTHTHFSPEAARGDSRVQLSAKERELLEYLTLHRGRVVSRAELLDQVWRKQRTHTRTVDMHVSLLRRKLGLHASSDPRLLTLRGRGYVFV